jgi:phage baseplate assembly protein W
MAINPLYSDIDLNFLASPATGDISLRYNQQAVIASIKNLLFTNQYERLFQPDIGSILNGLLFEPATSLTATLIEKEIVRMINNYEPRATIQAISVSAKPDKNEFDVSIYVLIGNQTSPTAINLILQRTR